MGTLLWEGIPVRLSDEDEPQGNVQPAPRCNHRHRDAPQRPIPSPLFILGRVSLQRWILLCARRRVSASSTDTPRLPRCARLLGSAVGIRQRRAAYHRSIHLRGEGGGCSPGSYCFFRTGSRGRAPNTRARRIEHFQLAQTTCGLPAVDVGSVLPVARPGARISAKTSCSVHAEEHARREDLAGSPISDFASGGGFKPVIEDSLTPNAERLLICSGKIAHDLNGERTRRGNTKTVIIRIDQLYPFQSAEMVEELRTPHEEKSLSGPGGAGRHGCFELHSSAPRAAGTRHRHGRALRKRQPGDGIDQGPQAQAGGSDAARLLVIAALFLLTRGAFLLTRRQGA